MTIYTVIRGSDGVKTKERRAYNHTVESKYQETQERKGTEYSATRGSD